MLRGQIVTVDGDSPSLISPEFRVTVQAVD
jgi:hypothetical protein